MKDGYESYSPVLGLGYREISACARTCRQRVAQGMKSSDQWTSRSWYLGRVLVENRNWLIATAMVTYTDGCAERDAALLVFWHCSRAFSGSGTSYRCRKSLVPLAPTRGQSWRAKRNLLPQLHSIRKSPGAGNGSLIAPSGVRFARK
jgi:hypothetical protein